MNSLIAQLSAQELLRVGLYFYAAFMVAILLLGVALDGDHGKLFLRLFVGMLITEIVTLLCEIGILILDGHPELLPLLYAAAFLSFAGGVLLIELYSLCAIAFIREYWKVSWYGIIPITIVCAIYFVLVVVSLFNGMFFSCDAAGHYLLGPYYPLVNFFDLALLLMVMYLIWHYRKVLTFLTCVSLLSFGVLPLITMGMSPFWGDIPIILSVPLAQFWTFILFHRQLNLQLAEKDRALAEKEHQLTQMHIAIMISQIQPHFIYNTLGSIHQLCLEQPERAAQLTLEFSQYLRGSLGELTKTRPIPLFKEMEHVRHYVHIEKVRFPDITVQFDLHCTNFQLPALSVQPLVENAIKHGLRGLDSGGTVIISSQETDNNYLVCIRDDGIGFDPAAPAQDGRLHVGIQNIRSRLEDMCGGTLVIDSAPGKGTTATIIIPKEPKEDNP